MDRQSRRWFLLVAGTGLVTLAGCSDPGEDEGDGEGDDEEDGEDNGDDGADDDGEDEEAANELRVEASGDRDSPR